MFAVLFCEEKYQKSARRTHAVLLPSHWRRARVSRANHAWQVHAAKDNVKVGGFAALRNLNHTTRANISHEEVEQIRARIVCTPAESARRACGSSCADETIKISHISLCSHPYFCHYFNHPVSATPTAFACANRSIPARFAVA